jgi:hypothetical protein
MTVPESFKLKTKWRITKFSDPNNVISAQAKKGASIKQLIKAHSKNFLGISTIKGNLGLNEGIAEALDLIFGLGTPTTFNTTTGRIGVGDSATAENATQTGLQAATNKAYVLFDDTYPSRTSQTVTMRATFGAGVGTFDWNEFTVINGADDTAKNLNRKVSAKGSKAAGESWIAEVAITLS